jgi:uncharacterized protein YbjQ (UPF0145 family)
VSTNPSDLPQHAVERLNRMASSGTRLWTSDLSVNEFLLLREAGFEPLGLVVGSSIYHIGFQSQLFRQNEELTVLSQAMYQARELAMTRMEEEADQLGADGVIGVRLDVNRYEWGPGLAEFMAVGTAVRSLGESHRPAHGKPFTSDLSGQDFWTLLKTGYRPVGLVMGSCVYHVAHQTLGQALRTIGQNTEMVNFTQALYDARELAMERMQAEAQEMGAEGIVAVHLHEGSHGWGSHVIEFFAVGTGVVAAHPDHPVPAPQLILPLTD